MAAGVGKTYRMLQEGRSAHAEGRDVVIGYLEPHDRPETALADGLEQVVHLRSEYGGLALEEMDVDAVVRRAPELALIDELAHTQPPEARNEKRWQDIDEVLDAGIDVISTVNIQHLESLNDSIAELTEVRVRETFPDIGSRVGADEVVLVDLTPEALQQRLRPGRCTRPTASRPRSPTSSALNRLSALRELALREVAEDVGARRKSVVLDPLSAQAVAERVLALVTPEPRSQRILRRAWRSAERLGAPLDALWVHPPGRRPVPEEQVQLAALRRLAVVLGAHFLEEEGDDLVETVKRVVRERGSTYVLVGTPDESRRREILHGSLVSALVRNLPGVDIRVIANRVDREERP